MVLVSLSLAAPLCAAAPLTEDVREAAASGRADLITTTVVAAIARNPSAVVTIVAESVNAAPNYRDAIAEGAKEAFPGFAARIEEAAGDPVAVAAAAPEESPDSPLPGWDGEISVGGSRNTGNTETSDINAAVDAIRSSANWEHEVHAEFAYSADSGNATAQRWLGNYQPRYNIGKRLYAFGFAQYLDDRFSGFSYEVSENAGLGYRILKDGPVTLSVEAGPGARHTEIAATGERRNELTVRGAAKLAWRISDHARFTNDTATTIGEERTLTSNVSAITADLIRNWALRLSFELRHNSSPPPGSEDLDTTTKGSLVYQF